MTLKPKGKLILLILLFTAQFLQAQFPYYKKFNINDGLVSNKVYNIIEDRHGFIWICTDMGVSRFDGVEFVNFTSKDGLPENEVLNMYEDQKGRIWFNTFSTEPCYYYNGNIYNSANDSFLLRVKKNKPDGMCMVVFVQRNGSIAFVIKEGDHHLIIGKETGDIYLKAPAGHTVRGYLFQNILYEDSSGYQLVSPNELIRWKRGKEFENVFSMWLSSFTYTQNPGNSAFILYKYKEFPKHILQVTFPGYTLKRIPVDLRYDKLFVNGQWHVLAGDSIYAIFDPTFTKVIETGRLPFAFERIFIDKKGNKWFGTFDNGVCLVRKNAPVKMRIPEDKTDGIIGIDTFGGKLLIRTETHGLMSLATNGELKKMYSNASRRIMGWGISGKHFVIGFDGGFGWASMDFTSSVVLRNESVKDVEIGHRDEVLLAGAASTYIFEHDSVRKVAKGRSSAICRIDDKTIWLGKMSGIEKLEMVQGEFVASRLSLNVELDRSRINDIKKDKAGNIWVATNQKGLFFCPPTGNIVRFSETSTFPLRLLSDMCTQIRVAADNSVWVATTSGISVIYYRAVKGVPVFEVRNYSIPEGMPGKTINAIEFWNGKIVVATPYGLYSFDHFPVPSHATSETVITEVKVSDVSYDPGKIELPYSKNSLIISYASSFINTGISYGFRYRVKQLDEEWLETQNMQVPLLGLEPGGYTFEVVALNALGQPGKVTLLHIRILTPWYRQWWFISAVVLLALGLVIYYFKLLRDKVNLRKNLTLLRLRILRAQMNPHFVFNALSNIQRLMHVGEAKHATGYLSVLASIMRKNIEYSGKEFITLDKEIEYTRHYLEIETLRFRNKFDYRLTCELDEEESGSIYVPPLLLQPVAENCVKHAFKGIATKGLLEISISKIDESRLRYLIKDNGCGFDTSLALPKDHGLAIAKERVELLYKNMDTKSAFYIVSNMQSPDQGTIVTIELPILKD